MHSDHQPYLRFSSRARMMKSIESLLGLIEGIEIDKDINKKELTFLDEWLLSLEDVKSKHPFNEIIPMVENSIKNRKISEEEKEDILWLCKKLASDSPYDDSVSSDIRRLHGILGGVAADGKILKKELVGLREWLSDHEDLKTCWPYDEIDSLISSVMADKKIDAKEHKMLLHWFSEFVQRADERVVGTPPIKINGTITGLCAVTPDIKFNGSLFCLTGASSRYKRSDLVEIIRKFNGNYTDYINKSVNYLIVGAEGNPCWQYACYGRKVEKAVEFRKAGLKLLIIHENDFHDAVADYTGE